MPHIHELIDFVITAIIVSPDKNRVLLANHPRYQMWIPIGGHIELEDDADVTLSKEIAEETGLSFHPLGEKPNYTSKGVKPLITPDYVDIHEANPPHKHHAFVYFVIATSDDFQKSDEHTALKWFTTQELREPQYNISDHTFFYAQKALEKARLV